MPARMRARMVAYTRFLSDIAEDITGWTTDVNTSSALAEFAGRACYQSWNKPNPATATNEGYLHHILEVGHDSVLRHGSVGFYLTGISRSLSHELIRHHVGTAVSQLSQRYVDSADMDYVVPPAMRGDAFTEEALEQAWRRALADYEGAVERLDPERRNRKKAREAARAFLPNMAETRMILTGNHQAWRNIIMQRGTVQADAEIRELAVELLIQLKSFEPNLYQDLVVVEAEPNLYVVRRVL